MLDLWLSWLAPAAFVFLFILQTLFPRRELLKHTDSQSRFYRLFQNLLLFLINTLLTRVVLSLSLAAVAIKAQQNQFGLFNYFELPELISAIACILLLDIAIYWQHVFTHKIPLLWRLHKVHHADSAMDVTTALRFHTLELLLSYAYKALLVVLLGVPVAAVVIFEFLMLVFPAFNHSNLGLPKAFDQLLRKILVTPDMHRVHHSVIKKEQNSNYGFFLSCWDYWFGSYTPQPEQGHQQMEIGLKTGETKYQRIDQMLLAPFSKD